MRRLLLIPVLTAAVLGVTAAPALASPPVPVPPVPQDCHDWNELLHIDNVMDCDGPSS